MRRVFCHKMAPETPTIDYNGPPKKRKKGKEKKEQNIFECENLQCRDKDGRPDSLCCGESANVSCGDDLHTIFGASCDGPCDDVAFCCTESKREESDCDAKQCRKGNLRDDKCCADPDDPLHRASCSPGYDMFVGAVCGRGANGDLRRIFCCKADAEDRYKCTDDLPNWKSWPEAQKKWCCEKTKTVACPGFSFPGLAPSQLAWPSDVPEERPIRGSQTWHAAGIDCDQRGAYTCGSDMQHCCCKFGCDYLLEEDGCTRCTKDAPLVKAHMIPISATWHGCVGDHMHDCGFGCCCNAGYKWGNESRICEASSQAIKLREAGNLARPCDRERQAAPRPNNGDADERAFVMEGSAAIQESQPAGGQPAQSTDVANLDITDTGGNNGKADDGDRGWFWWLGNIFGNWR